MINTFDSTTALTIDNETQEIVSEAQDRRVSDLMKSILQEEKNDWITPANAIHFRQMGDQYGIRLSAQPTEHPLTDWGLGQLNDRLAAGLNTVCKKMDEPEKREHYTRFVQGLLDESDKDFMVRTVNGGRARAVLSSSYAPIDDDLVFGEALPIIADSRIRMEPIGGNRTDVRTFMKFVSRDSVFSFNDGKRQREFHVGFIMSNSEVGSGYAAFQAFLTDSYCKNGCIFSKLEIANAKFMHRGSAMHTDVPQLMGAHMLNVKTEAATNMIQEATRLAVSGKGQDQIRAVLMQANEQKVTGSPVEAVKALAKNIGASEDEGSRLLQLSGNESNTRFGMQAAVTQMAQESKTYERRIELEKAGGDVLTNDRLWKAIYNLEA